MCSGRIDDTGYENIEIHGIDDNGELQLPTHVY